MEQQKGQLLFSPSDLNDFVACEHLTQLRLAVARGDLARPATENPHAELIQRKGDEHEAAYLAALGDAVVRIELGEPPDWERAAADTAAAIRAGAPTIYQAVFVHDGWRGIADFLERQPDGTYEAADTKLARHTKPSHVLQLCFYSAELARLQGREPAWMHVLLGSGERESYRPAEFAAYYRRARARFLAAVAAGIDVYPLPVPHCDLCDFKERCEARWEADDHLVRVANVYRHQITRLADAGITTLAGLAAAPDGRRPTAMPVATYEAVRDQASLQLQHRETGEHDFHLLPPELQRGFALLPEPSPGDVFFDIEGDPFWQSGRSLEYLWGVVEVDSGEPLFRGWWAHDPAEERRALEAFVDHVRARLERWPDLHVYYYASYEPSALKRLMGEFGTREDEIDDLLRREVFVDLFKVVRQSLRHSHPRYSLKHVETFYLEREAELRAGDDSILMYERWLEERDDAVLGAIEEYNREDCLSTHGLREWLLELRRDAEAQFAEEIPWFPVKDTTEPPDPEAAAETDELRARLIASGETLLAQLLGYHKREARPGWWAFFHRCGQTSEELTELDSEAIGGLEPSGAPIGSGKSLVYPFRFPAQQHKLDPGDDVSDPATESGAGTIERLDDATGELWLRRGPRHEEVPLPRSVIPGGPIPTREQQAALRRLARDPDRFPAAQSLLHRELPRIAGHEGPLPQDDAAAARALVERLDRSHLVVQGPPGTGKTYLGARLIVQLIAAGRRVGVAAQSHKSIHNLLDEVEKVARAESVSFRGLKKGSSYEGLFIETCGDQAKFSNPDDDVLLLAGTAWLFSRGDMEGVVDTLFVDEAGQVSLADALAMATCARNVVLLGDPQQLAHVSQGTHPEGAAASALEHLLDGADTIPPERGLFLGVTWRMHPDVAAFVSEISYEGRLRAADECARQATAFGTGLRFVAVEHEGNRVGSPEEAEAIRDEIERMVGGDYTDARGVTRPLRYGDFMVVAPFNAHVRCLRAALPEAVPVGTVDKFQGQEAPVVFFSMATSGGEDVPRGLEFLFSRNRLNVAISRARCLAVLVASPKLLEIRCRTVEQMRMVNALCRLVEHTRLTSRYQ